MISVAIVDDHPIARRGVAAALAEAGGVDVVASVDSPADLAEHLTDGPAALDVVILDLYTDGDNPGLPALQALALRTRVLAMSASGRSDDVLGAIRAGARGYITKQTRPDLFAMAVQTVASGGFWISSQLADILQVHLTNPEQAGAAPLSPREEQTLDLIARGFTHGQTASRMGISKATVDTYVERIRTKLQVGNKAELTRAALQRLPRAGAGPI